VSVVRKTNKGLLCGWLLLQTIWASGSPILVLKGPNAPPYKEALSGFRQVYSGGIEIDNGKAQEFLRRLQTDPPPLIVAIGRASAEMARERAGDIPLLFVMVPKPAESGLIGKNIAGISMDVPGNVQLAHFKELLPDPKKPVAIVYNPSSSKALIAEAQAEASRLDLPLELVSVESPEQVRMRISLIKPIVGAIWVVPDESFAVRERDNKWFTFLVDETIALRMPLFMTMNAASKFIQEGALGAVVSDFGDMGRQCGELVKQIEAGKTKLADIGVIPPATVRWKVNPTTAQKIGMRLPPKVLQSSKNDQKE
jgi:putative ABC transport system substrate-binding protein